MDHSAYQIMDEVQEDHWWWLGRKRVIESLLERFCNKSGLNIADVGSGSGANVPILRPYGNITALELNEALLDKLSKRWPSVTPIKWKSPEPVADRFDLILLADVLEHIPNDKEAIEWIWQHLTPGGQVLITVPANEFLWTEMDDVCHHHRRYNRTQLCNLFSEKFEIQYCSFYNMTLFPVKLLFVVFANTLRKIFPQRPKQTYNDIPPKLINSIFTFILRIEAKIMLKVPFPLGCSLALLASKR